MQKKKFTSSFEMWKHILLEKFKHPEFRDILLGTGDAYLLEFSRGAKKETHHTGADLLRKI